MPGQRFPVPSKVFVCALFSGWILGKLGAQTSDVLMDYIPKFDQYSPERCRIFLCDGLLTEIPDPVFGATIHGALRRSIVQNIRGNLWVRYSTYCRDGTAIV
jgi:hypothetical protein